jgi:hypothetical protein
MQDNKYNETNTVEVQTECKRTQNKIPVEARFSAPVQTFPGTHPASYKMGTGSLSWA